jgi:hypothetical protein
MSTATTIQFGDGLAVTDLGGGTIRVDGAGGPAGQTGPPGSQGPQGPQGPVAPTYTFTQTLLTTNWTITHNLNRYPSIEVVDSGGNVVEPDSHYVDANTITLTFGAPTMGKAYLN